MTRQIFRSSTTFGRPNYLAPALTLVLGSGLLSGCGLAESDLDPAGDDLEADLSPLESAGATAAFLDVSGTVARAVEKRLQTNVLAAGSYLFELSGNGGDADLYVGTTAPPTTTLYSCRPYRNGSNETCLVNLAAASRVWLMVRGYAPSSSYRLVGRPADPTAAAP